MRTKLNFKLSARRVLVFLLLTASSLVIAATTPVDRIQRGGGRVIVNSNGSVTITNPSGTGTTLSQSLSLNGISAPSVSGAGTGKIYFDSGANVFKASLNGGAYANLVGSGDMLLGTAQTVTARKTFTPDATTAMLNIGSAASNPSTPVAGDFYLNSGDNKAYLFSNTAWREVFLAGVSLVNLGSNVTGTLDAEASGITITTPYVIEFIAAGANAGTGGPMLDVPSSNGPAAGVVSGTNIIYGVLDFDAATDESVQGSFWLPDDWTGSIDLSIDWQAGATSGSTVWSLQTICVANDESSDPAFNSAQTVTDASLGTANRRNTASISTITVTGCAAGERLHFKFSRDADNGSDDMTGDARLKALRFKVRRAM